MKFKKNSNRPSCIRVSWGQPPSTLPSIELPASKSELNRMLVLAALRNGPTQINGKNSCEDVTKMIQSLSVLGLSITETEKGYETTSISPLLDSTDERILDCGSGGTTLRFLMGIASARPGKTQFQMTSQLMKRPIHQWLEVLQTLGAQIEELPQGFSILGTSSWPHQIAVPIHQSSQFASSLALICSGLNHSSQLILKGQPVSQSYFNLTLELLKLTGTTVEKTEEGILIDPASKEQQKQNLSLEAEGDASSGAIWLAAGALGWPVAISNFPKTSRQADTRILEFLSSFSCSCSQSKEGLFCNPSSRAPLTTRRICLTESPDLAPVLGVISTLLPGKTILYGAEHLRFKESNRIEDFPKVLAPLGLSIEPRPDGLEAQGPQKPNPGIVPTFGDHRFAMAGSLCAARSDYVVIQNPQVVTKSYPQFWEHAQQANWKIEEEVKD